MQATRAITKRTMKMIAVTIQPVLLLLPPPPGLGSVGTSPSPGPLSTAVACCARRRSAKEIAVIHLKLFSFLDIFTDWTLNEEENDVLWTGKGQLVCLAVNQCQCLPQFSAALAVSYLNPGDQFLSVLITHCLEFAFLYRCLWPCNPSMVIFASD